MFTGQDDEQLFPHFEQPKRRPVPEARQDGEKRPRKDVPIDTAEPVPPPAAAAPPPPAEPAPADASTQMVASNAADNAAPASNVVADDEVIECLHEIAWPPGMRPPDEPKAKIDRPPARTYPFTLDPFQRASVQCLEREESVLVAAHTSAGKTVVAEYAIAMSLRDKQRVIYTSPIKALSNQKYRELYEDFQDVGLMTGDVTINPAASCLVMTTEILRSMLYRGSEVMREVKWVIFDEIHYMRDKERGVVWEETIILLPDQVRYVFLSATIPNALEFARWIAKIHSQPCHVVYTDRRPTPLQHYIFPAGGDGLHLVVDEKGAFREENFNKALSQLMSPVEKADKMKGKRGGGKGNAGAAAGDAYKIVKMIMERKYDPVIVFAFSKKECEFLALQMSKLDFNNDDERKLIDGVFRNAVDSLSEDDKKLPQIEHILPLLKRGIGIHHSGLLPILKEVIEILFQEGLLKALFATETFSIGLNMPAKTVLFTSVRKFDGSAFRWLGGGEYIQMSGRAGRRGIDERGIVILCVDEKMEPSVAKGMLKGHADPLNSSFHLGYNMLLNLLRFEGVDPEFLIRRSFHQFQHDQHLPVLQAKLAQLETQLGGMVIPDAAVVEDYFLIRSQLENLRGIMHKVMVEPIHMLPFMQPGRLVKVNNHWGVVVNFQKKPTSALPPAADGAADDADRPSQAYIVDTLLPPAASAAIAAGAAANGDAAAGMEVTPVMLHTMQEVSSMRIYLPRDLRTAEARSAAARSVREVQKRFPDGIPLLDPVEDLQIEDEAFKKVLRKIEMLEDQLAANPAFATAAMQAKYQRLIERKKLEGEIRELKKELKSADSVVMKDELKAMKRVLRRLGYTNPDGIIEMKGRVCCEINAADEIVLSEMMFNGVFNDLSPEQCAALLSCFVFQEKSSENQKLPDELAGPLQTLQETARKVARVSQECKLTVNTEEYVQGFRPHLMDVVYQWAKGAKFIDVCKLTDIFEGSIIRCMRRLEELMRQLCQAAKAIGNTDLEQKFSDAIAKIKRDIVFAASLYL